MFSDKIKWAFSGEDNLKKQIHLFHQDRIKTLN